MGKALTTLRQLIKEELDIALVNESEIEDIVDYLIDDESEEQTAEELEESQGRSKGNSRLYRLKGDHTIDDVKTFLKKIQSKISSRKTQGRKSNNFTDEDIEAFSELLTKPEGFDRHEIVDTLSFYKDKPNGFRAAQRLMDILGDTKMTSNLDKKGDTIEIGKGYIEVADRPKKSKEDNSTDLDDDTVLSMDELEPTDFGKSSEPEPSEFEDTTGFEDDEDEEEDEYPKEEDYINETVKMFQKRAGLLNG